MKDLQGRVIYLTIRAGNESNRTCLNSTRLVKNWLDSNLGSSLARTFFSAQVQLV